MTTIQFISCLEKMIQGGAWKAKLVKGGKIRLCYLGKNTQKPSKCLFCPITAVFFETTGKRAYLGTRISEGTGKYCSFFQACNELGLDRGDRFCTIVSCSDNNEFPNAPADDQIKLQDFRKKLLAVCNLQNQN